MSSIRPCGTARRGRGSPSRSRISSPSRGRSTRAGVDYIEAGNPHSNPKDEEFFRRAAGELRLSHARLVAFGSTRRRDSSAGEDKNVAALLETGTACVAVFGKASEWQAREVLGTTPEENLRMIADTVAYLAEAGRRVFFDAEHFFDGYKHNPLYAMQALKAAADAGACKLILCDTNGGCFPDEIRAITAEAVRAFPGKIGIHCHNDTGCAVADTLAAVKAGADHVQGTYIGFGERCGNTNLSTVIADLQLKLGFQCVPADCIARMTARRGSFPRFPTCASPIRCPMSARAPSPTRADARRRGEKEPLRL